MREFLATWAARDLFDRGGPVGVRLISSHDRVINLWAEGWGQMLMLAAPGMYRGPGSSGLSLDDFRAIHKILKPGNEASYLEGRIEFHGSSDFRLSLSDAERVSFEPPSELKLNPASLASASVAAVMAELAAPHLCSCLLAAPGGGPPADPFAKVLVRDFPRLVQALGSGNQALFEEACSTLVGLGCGSTPTGDDLIHGALLALHYLKRASSLDLALPSLPGPIQKRTTLLGAHMLRMGLLGLTPEPMREFASRLFAGRPLDGALVDLRRMGSDSGVSSALGFYLAARGIAQL